MSKRRARRVQPTTDQRPPEARLEAMVRERNQERSSRTLGRIRNDLDAADDAATGPWIAAARSLSERLIISERVLYYFVEIFLEPVIFAASDSDSELVTIRDEMDAIERAHGLRDDEFWHVDEAPADWQALNDAWNRRADAIGAAHLRSLGHSDIATFYESKRAEFEELGEQGRVELFGELEEMD